MQIGRCYKKGDLILVHYTKLVYNSKGLQKVHRKHFKLTKFTDIVIMVIVEFCKKKMM